MSDGEATGGEMSDGGRKKKAKLRINGSPSGSRAGSPDPSRARSIGAGGSRAGSPSAASDMSRAQSPGAGPIQPYEIAAALPPSGILIGELMKRFAGRVGDGPGQTPKKDFIQLVKVNSKYGPDRILRPK